MEVKRADELSENPRPALARIFVEGFYRHLSVLSKDKEKLARAFEHSFDLAHFHVLLVDGKIAAFVGISDKTQPIVKLEGKILRRHLGIIKGTMANFFLKKEMTEKAHPFALAENTGSIDFVATAPEHRGRGLSFQLLQETIKKNAYEKHVLEVVDNNSSAIRLYEKLGFKEFLRVPMKAAKRAGFESFIYMKN